MMLKRRLFFILIVFAAFVLIFSFQSSRAQSSLPPAQEEHLEILRDSLGQGLPEYLQAPALYDSGLEGGQSEQEINALNLPAWYQIVFQVPGSETWDLYLMNGQSTEIRPFIDGNDNDMYPAFAYTGDRVFLAREVSNNEFDLHSYTVDQSSFVRLTDTPGNDLDPQPSPDGIQVVFQSLRDGNSEIYVMDADGSNPRRVTEHPGYDGEPTWSPDGTQIAFVSDRGGVYDLWVMNADGGDLRQLTSGAYAFTPAWSPNGNRIAVSMDSNLDGFLELWLVGADGDGSVRPLQQFTNEKYDYWKPVWTPDGNTILFIQTGWQYDNNYQEWYIWGSQITQYDVVTENSLGAFGFSYFVWGVDIVAPDQIAPTSCHLIKDDAGSVAGDGALFRIQADDSGYIGAVAYQVQARSDAYREWQDVYTWLPVPGGVMSGGIYASQELRCRAVDSGGNWGPWSAPPYTRLEYDAAPPESMVLLGAIDPLAEQASLTIRAYDLGVGIANVDLYARTQDADTAWDLYLADLQPGEEILFPIQAGVTYEVRSSAVDRVGNYEIWSPIPDLTFTSVQPSRIANQPDAVSEFVEDAAHAAYLPMIQQGRDAQEYTSLLNDWPTYGQNYARTSFSDREPGASHYERIWSETVTACSDYYSLSLGGGVLAYSLAGCDNLTPRLVARDPRFGTFLWRQDGIAEDMYAVFMDSTLKYGRIFQHYVGNSFNNRIISTHLRSGNNQWEISLANRITNGPYGPLISQDTLYTFLDQGWLAAYDAASGMLRWTSRNSSATNTTLALATDPQTGSERLVTHNIDGLKLLHMNSGFMDWGIDRTNFDASLFASPVIDGNLALFQFDYELVAVDWSTHQVLWSLADYNHYMFDDQPAVDGNEIYVIIYDALQVLDRTDGSLLWDFAVPGDELLGTPVLTKKYVFVQTLSNLYIVDRESHTVVQVLPGFGQFIVADGHLYRLRQINNESDVIIEIYRAENP